MSIERQTTEQNAENTNNEELFRSILSDVIDAEYCEFEEYTEILSPPSKRHKIRINRLFRERVGGSFLPFPEVDNLYERIRSKLVVKLF